MPRGPLSGGQEPRSEPTSFPLASCLPFAPTLDSPWGQGEAFAEPAAGHAVRPGPGWVVGVSVLRGQTGAVWPTPRGCSHRRRVPRGCLRPVFTWVLGKGPHSPVRGQCVSPRWYPASCLLLGAQSLLLEGLGRAFTCSMRTPSWGRLPRPALLCTRPSAWSACPAPAPPHTLTLQGSSQWPFLSRGHPCPLTSAPT